MELSVLNNALLAIAVISTAIYALKLALYYFTGADSDISGTFETDADSAFTFISLQSVLAFLMGFGWAGLAASVYLNTDAAITLFAAFAAALLLMYISAYLTFAAKKLDKAVKFDINELKDKKGRAYTSFKPQSKGQIEIDFNERLSVLDAYNSSDEEIEAFSEIKVLKIENSSIYIIKA